MDDDVVTKHGSLLLLCIEAQWAVTMWTVAYSRALDMDGNRRLEINTHHQTSPVFPFLCRFFLIASQSITGYVLSREERGAIENTSL